MLNMNAIFLKKDITLFLKKVSCLPFGKAFGMASGMTIGKALGMALSVLLSTAFRKTMSTAMSTVFGKAMPTVFGKAMPMALSMVLSAALSAALSMTLCLGLTTSLSAQMNPLRPLEVGEVVEELERKLRQDATYQTLWNTGYQFYRVHLRNQDTARVIFRAYMLVTGNNPEQEKAIKQAAIYWQKIHDYGITNVPVGIDNSLRETVPNPRRGRMGTLKMLKPKGGPVPLRESEATMANRAKRRMDRRDLKGRRINPYPGPYYPGVYPP
jgi:hypothetical protein